MIPAQLIADLDDMISRISREISSRETAYRCGQAGGTMMTSEQASREFSDLRDVVSYLNAARRKLSPTTPPPERRPGRRVLGAVAEVFGVPVGTILSPRRSAPVAAARQAVYYVLREALNWTLGEIGHFLKRDHSTVLSGLRKAGQRLASDPDFATRLRDVLAQVGEG